MGIFIEVVSAVAEAVEGSADFAKAYSVDKLL